MPINPFNPVSLGSVGRGVDLTDPYALIKGAAPAFRASRSVGNRPAPLTEEEESSILERSVGAFQYVGESLDKPFAAVRGLVHGATDVLQGETPNWGGGLLNLIPFSGGFLGDLIPAIAARPKDKVSGRDVLENWGAPANRDGFHPIKGDKVDAFWDVAGLATELALGPPIPVGPWAAAARQASRAAKMSKAARKINVDDTIKLLRKPHTGAVTEAGRLATAIKSSAAPIDTIGRGLSPQAMANQIRKGERAAISMELPEPIHSLLGKPGPIMEFGKGGKSGALFAKILEGASYGTYSPIAFLRGRFSHALRGVKNPKQQKVMDAAYDTMSRMQGALTNYTPSAYAAMDNLAERFRQLTINAARADAPESVVKWEDFIREIGETKGIMDGAVDQSSARISEIFEKMSQAKDPNVALTVDGMREVAELSNDIRETVDGGLGRIKGVAFDEMDRLGIAPDELRDYFAAHWPRRMADDVAGDFSDMLKQNIVDLHFGHATHRSMPLRDIPGRTGTLNMVSRDTLLGRPASNDEVLTAIDIPTGTHPFKRDIKALSKLLARSMPVRMAGKHGNMQLGQTVAVDGIEGVGRISGIADDTFRVQFMVDGKVGTKVVDHDATRPLLDIPEGTQLPPPVISKKNQTRMIQDWLQDRNIPVEDVHGKLLSEAALRREYVWARYFKPGLEFDNIGPDAVKAFDLTDSYQKELFDVVKGLKEGRVPYELSEDGTVATVNLYNWLKEVKAGSLAEYTAKHQASGAGWFSNRFAEDWTTMMHGAINLISNAQVMRDSIKQTARIFATPTKEGAEMVPLQDVWYGIKKMRGNKRAMSEKGLMTLADEIHKASGSSWAEAVENAAIRNNLDLSKISGHKEAIEAALDEIRVPPELSGALQAMYDIARPGSEAGTALGEVQDKWLRLWKTGVTLPWPAFHSRNLVSGFGMNVIDEGTPYGVRELSGAYKDVMGEMGAWEKGFASLLPASSRKTYKPGEKVGGRAITSAEAGLLNERTQADTARLLNEMVEIGVVDAGHLFDIRGFLKTPISSKPGEFPALGRAFGALIDGIKNRRLNPLAVEGGPGFFGFGHKGGPQNAVVEAGSEAYKAVEFINRGAPYLAARRAGWEPARAKALVERLQYDYAQGAPFEKTVMRRVFPFYGWMRNNFRRLGADLSQNIGSRTALAVRTGLAIQRDSGWLPDWLKEQMAVRIDSNDAEDTAEVITQWGLHFEDLKNLGVGPNWKKSITRNFEKAVGQSNPALQLLGKIITGRDLRTGRNLKDMHTNITGLDVIDRHFAPPADPLRRATVELLPYFGRAGATVRKFTDDRTNWKWMLANFTTGLRSSTHNMELQKQIQLRDNLEEMLDESPLTKAGTFRFIPEEVLPFVPKKIERAYNLLPVVKQTVRHLREREAAAGRP
jgi:hypothetical protein